MEKIMVKNFIGSRILTFSIVFSITTFLITYFLYLDQYVDKSVIAILTILILYINNFELEYQRIVLILSRCVKKEVSDSEDLKVKELYSLLLTINSKFIIIHFLNSLISGIVYASALRFNLLLLVLLVFIKFNAFSFLFPYKIAFEIIKKNTIVACIYLKTLNYVKSAKSLATNFKNMPKDKAYEDWAYKKYGNKLTFQ